jgi:hypothetical protein
MKNTTIAFGFLSLFVTIMALVFSFTIKDPFAGRILIFVNALFLGIGVCTLAYQLPSEVQQLEDKQDHENEMRGVWDRFDEEVRQREAEMMEIRRELSSMWRDVDQSVMDLKREIDNA